MNQYDIYDFKNNTVTQNLGIEQDQPAIVISISDDCIQVMMIQNYFEAYFGEFYCFGSDKERRELADLFIRAAKIINPELEGT